MTTTYKCVMLCLVFLWSISIQAQERTDSLIINVGKSRIIFLVKDKKDLETLKNYDLNIILEKLSLKLENDSTGQSLVKEENGKTNHLSDTTIVVKQQIEIARPTEPDDVSTPDEENDAHERNHKHHKGTRHFFNIDLGTNNYLQEGNFPDATNEPYSVRPFGSWYVGLAPTNKTYIAGPLYLEWGPSVTWYNFKFQNDRMRVTKGSDATTFSEDVDFPDADFKKSKLTIAYVNFSVVPMFHVGKVPNRKQKGFIGWSDGCFKMESGSHNKGGFRIGAGGYAGYRIASYTKVVYDNGDKEKDKNKDSYHLNSFRYGLRVQMGYRDTDFFFNYDMNELFAEGKGPDLNAFSFGIIL